MARDLFNASGISDIPNNGVEQAFRAVWFAWNASYKQWTSVHVGNFLELPPKVRNYTHSAATLQPPSKQSCWEFCQYFQAISHPVTRGGHNGGGHPEFHEGIQNNPESSFTQWSLPSWMNVRKQNLDFIWWHVSIRRQDYKPEVRRI